MKKQFIRWMVLALGAGSFACTLSFSVAPNTSIAPAQTEQLTVPIGTASRTASPTIAPPTETPIPTITNTKTPATPVTLDPADAPKGDIAFEKGNCCNEDGVYLVTPKISGRGILDFLYGQVSDPEWSPDGKRIALRLYRWRKVSETTSYWVDDIAVINRDGGGFKKLTKMEEGDRLWEYSWSPDGRWIAVVRSRMEPNYTYSEYAVWILKTDGSGTMKKIGDTTNVDAHVDWLPDSQRLVFVEPGGQLVIASIETGEARTVKPIASAEDGYRIFDVSADGNSIVYLDYSETEYSLRKLDLEGWTSEDAPAEETLYTGAMEKDIHVIIPMAGDLALSPGGGSVIFFLTEPGKATLQLFAIGSDAPVTLAELTDYSPDLARLGPEDHLIPVSPNWKPGWSSDGEWIVFATAVSGQGWENGNIYIINHAQALAGTIEPILVAEHGRNPDWQPAV
jgi:dipeptidyl aminopeptidase/acylaminoacyl peptidase